MHKLIERAEKDQILERYYRSRPLKNLTITMALFTRGHVNGASDELNALI